MIYYLLEEPGTIIGWMEKQYTWNTWGEILISGIGFAGLGDVMRSEFYEGGPAVTFS